MSVTTVMSTAESPSHPVEKNSEINQGRRRFCGWLIGGAAALAVVPDRSRAALLGERSLQFYNPNTGESFQQVYWTPRDGYLSESISRISWVLRDHHINEVKLFDPNVLDQLYAVQLQLGLRQPINVISGYRSPITNQRLAEGSRRVARNSYHIQAKALDIRLPSGRLADLYRAARSLGAGGVGYYRRSNFIHIDSGPVRYWG